MVIDDGFLCVAAVVVDVKRASTATAVVVFIIAVVAVVLDVRTPPSLLLWRSRAQ